jgi:hypothetical protein
LTTSLEDGGVGTAEMIEAAPVPDAWRVGL